jgi:TP901 family phage tail tape measure protein
VAERVVKVRLSAEVAAYNKAMQEAAKSTSTVGTEAQKLAQKKRAFEQLGGAMFIAGGVMAAGVGIAVAKFAEFDEAMSAVVATGEDALANQDALRQAALDAGAATVFSATESANAIEEMAKAGLTATEILGGGLKGALDLAAAGGLGVAEAAGITATTMKQFNLEGEDAAHVADLLAAGAGKAMGDVTDMSGALSQAGLVANQFGLDVEETVGVLSAFASAGMLGSDAGTSMRTMLLRLANPTDEVKDLMAGLNIQAYDQQGNFVGLANLAGQLEGSLGGLTQAQRDQNLAMIFGQDAIRGANILLREGKDGIQDWTAAVDDQGFAAEMASTRLDNLNGDIEALGGAMDTALISTGSAANDVLRTMVQAVTALVDLYNGLPEPVQASALAIGAVAAAVGLVAGGLLIAVPKAVEFKTSLDLLGVSMGRVALIAGGVAAGIGIVVTIIGALAMAHAEARAKAEAYADTLEAGTNRVTKSTRDMAKEALAAKNSFLWIEKDSAFDAAERLGISLDLVTDAATGNAAAMKELQRQMESGNDGSLEYANSVADITNAVRGENASIEEAIRVAEQKQEADKDSAESTGVVTEAVEEMAAETEEATAAVDDLKDALDAIGGTAMTMGDAIDAAQGAINDLIDAAEQEEVTLGGANDASIAFRDSIREVEQSHRDAAQAIIDNGGTFEDARTEWERGREAIIRQIEAMGYSREEAERWANDNLGAAGEVVGALSNVANAVNNVPPAKPINITLLGYHETYQYLQNIQATLRNITGDNRIRVSTGQGGSGGLVAGSANGNMFDYQAFAAGGFPTGIYAGRVGSIHKFAEPETVWEAYISGKPDQRDRNVGIWQETGRRLGVDAGAAANVTLDGAHLTGSFELVGDGMLRMIDGRISLYDKQQSQAAARGYSGGL